MIRRAFIVLTFWLYSVVMGQTDPVLQQSIQVVREWLNDPQAEVEFRFHVDTSLGLSGPRNAFHFRHGIYEIIVNIDKMKIISWSIDFMDWADQARTDLPEKSEAEIIHIARDYAIQHFPYFNEFSEWETTVTPFHVETFQGKEATEYIVSFTPYVTNKLGVKIPVLTTICSVDIDPYEGKVIGFYQRHIPMTLTNLMPNFSIEEAKTRMEQAFLNLGAAQAIAIIPSEQCYEFGLVIGATQTSGLRLAYSGGAETVGSPGYEEEFGTEEEPQIWYAAIDAHTGELLYREPILGAVNERSKERLLYGSQRGYGLLFSITGQQWWLILSILIIGCLTLFWIKWKKKL